MRRADADRGRPQRPAVGRVRLDPAAPHAHDHDGRAVAGGGDPAGLEGGGLDGDLAAPAHQRHRAGVLVAHEDHRAGRGRVMRLAPDAGIRHHLAARQRDLEQPADLLRWDENRAGGPGELQVPRRARQPHDHADPPGRDVDKRYPVGPAQPDREDAVAIVHRQALGSPGHRHHGASGRPRQRGRPGRFRHVGARRSGGTGGRAPGGRGREQQNRHYPPEHAHAEDRRRRAEKPAAAATGRKEAFIRRGTCLPLAPTAWLEQAVGAIGRMRGPGGGAGRRAVALPSGGATARSG